MAEYEITLGKFDISCECENCDKTFSYETILVLTHFCNFIPSPPQSSINDLVAQLQDMRKKMLNNEDYPSTSVKKCPHCKYLQSWMIGRKKTDISSRVALILSIIPIVLIFWKGEMIQKIIRQPLILLIVCGFLIYGFNRGMFFLCRPICKRLYRSNRKFGIITRKNKPTLKWHDQFSLKRIHLLGLVKQKIGY